MQQEKVLLKNTAIYAIANFGSKILSLLVVPLYTHYIDPNELGIYDLIITTITLLIPLLTFQMSDGVYRWLLDPQQDRVQAIHSAMRLVMRNYAITTLLMTVAAILFPISYIGYIYFLLLLYSFVPILQQIARGLGNNKVYAFSGVLSTALFLLGSVFLVVNLKLGCLGMLIAQIVAYMITGIYLLWRCPQVLHSVKMPRQKQMEHAMLRYSLPLVPNTINWWAINTSNRYFILAFLGTTANGIYAISSKFPSLLYMCTTIFYLAWQESAITTAGAEDSSAFQTHVFTFYTKLLFALTGFLIPITRVIVVQFMAASYADAWQYCGFLYIGMVFSALSSFLGTSYQVAKETKGALYTTLISAAISIALCVGLIRFMGLQAVSLSICLSYIVLFFIRWKDCTRYVQLCLDWKGFWFGFLYVVIMAVVVLLCDDRGNWICIGIAALAALMILFRDITGFFQKLRKRG